MATRLLTRNDEVTPLVSEAEWHNQYPLVDREYVWIYPLIRNEPFDPLQIFDDATVPFSSLNTSVYIHIPACFFRCPMCPFYLEVIKDRDDLLGYTDALIKELEMYKNSPIISELNLRSIYFGGGTATTLYPKDIGRIIRKIKELIPHKDNIDITVEGHPSVVDYNYISTLYDQGVTRISFGIQSFQEKTLQLLGLRQTPEINKKSLKDAIKLGFKTVSMDLLYRVPNQTIQDIDIQINEALNMGVTSISAYSLELSVRQWKLKDSQPDESVDRDMFYYIHDKLVNQGWHHTAQPDYAVLGHINQDIITTWHAPQGQMLSLGAGSWSDFNGVIYCTVHDIAEYKCIVEDGLLPILTGQVYTIDDAMSRYPVLGARCFYIPNKPFKETFGINLIDAFGPEVRKLKKQGLITIQKDDIKVSYKGKYYIDNISKTFYSIANRCRLQPWGAKIKGLIASSYSQV